MDPRESRLLVAAITVAAFVHVAPAIQIQFTHEGTVSGQLNGVPFSSRLVVFQGTGDTASRYSFSQGFAIEHSSAQVIITGLGTFSVLSPTRTFVNNVNSNVGLSNGGNNGPDLFDGPTSSVLTSWDMLSSIGPISGSGERFQTALQTSGGLFSTATGFPFSVAFTASVVPAPQAISVFAITGFAACGRRRRANAVTAEV